jgi:hypothetical protein
MDYYEIGLFNQMLASRRDMDSTESPEVTYFVPVQPGQRRSYGNVGTCCGGTGMESHTKYQDSIYFRSVDDSALFVNLYISSTLRWPGKGFTITQESRFPEEGASTLVVDGSGPLDIRLRVPAWVKRGFFVRINGELQGVDAFPGMYLSLSRRWSSGDRIELEMPFTFRVEGTIDDPTVQSVHYGPILLAVQAGPVGETLESGLLEVGFYRYLKLDGDLASAMTPAGSPLHFTTQGLNLAPFFVADPPSSAVATQEESEDGAFEGSRRGPPTQPYHIYFRRKEPRIVFGSVDAGVPNPEDPEGLTFLDGVWAEAPFRTHEAFISTVERLVSRWVEKGTFSEGDGAAVLDAARRAEEELRV